MKGNRGRNAETQSRREKNEEGLRAFVALEIPEDVVGTLVSSRRELESTLPKARWVRVENQHLTLRFLGEVPRDGLETMAERLAVDLEGVPAVSVSLGGAGFFPGPSRPRVAWIGGEASGIEAVLEGVDKATSVLGLEAPGEPWTLHLTQARLVKPWRAGAVRAFLDWGQALRLPQFQAREVVVFTSELRRGGAVYTDFERIRLV
ncbi:MAG: RNA 2',3'-cyclic phosphodiesterase [Acidobacteriota bacterium]